MESNYVIKTLNWLHSYKIVAFQLSSQEVMQRSLEIGPMEKDDLSQRKLFCQTFTIFTDGEGQWIFMTGPFSELTELW